MTEPLFSPEEVEVLCEMLLKHNGVTTVRALQRVTGLSSMVQHFRKNGRPITRKTALSYAKALDLASVADLIQKVRKPAVAFTEGARLPADARRTIARVESQRGRYAIAARMFEDLALEASTTGDMEASAEYFRKAGNQNRFAGNLDKASSLFTSSANSYIHDDHPSPKHRTVDHLRRLEQAHLEWVMGGKTSVLTATLKELAAAFPLPDTDDRNSTKASRLAALALQVQGDYSAAEARFSQCKEEATRFYNFPGALLSEIGELNCRKLVARQEPNMVRLRVLIAIALKFQWIHAYAMAMRTMLDILIMGDFKSNSAQIEAYWKDYWRVVPSNSIDHLQGKLLEGRHHLQKRQWDLAEESFRAASRPLVPGPFNTFALEQAMARFGQAEILRLRASRKSSTSYEEAEQIYEEVGQSFYNFSCRWGVVRCEAALRLRQKLRQLSYTTPEGVDARLNRLSSVKDPIFFDSFVL